ELRRLQSQVETAAGTLVVPAALSKNVAVLASLCALSRLDSRILEFVTLMHAEPLLATAVDTIGRVAKRDLPFVLAALLSLPVAETKDALSASSALIRSGLIKVSDESTELSG